MIGAALRAERKETRAMAEQERWGVWITQEKPRRGEVKPDSYWWQGPDYKGDYVTNRAWAEANARAMQLECPDWRYEARRYDASPK